MTNEEKFETAEERFLAFREFCKNRACESCSCKGKIHGSDYKCMLEWLELEYEVELKPCLLCGSKEGEAEWELGEEYEYAYCSHCRHQQWASWDSWREAIDNIRAFYGEYKFCPNCGYKMK